MRPIKFRAWFEEEKTMLYDIQNMYDGMGGPWLNSNGDEVDIYALGFNCSFSEFLEEDGDEEEGFKKPQVMQYTGLKDKNGNEIYEGDIVLIPDEYTDVISQEIGGPTEPSNHIAPVIYTKYGAFGVNLESSQNYFKKGETPFYEMVFDMGEEFISEEVSVLGNIYENPELLK